MTAGAPGTGLPAPPSRRPPSARFWRAARPPGSDRHHHLHGLRPPGQRPDHLHLRGHHGRHRPRSAATPPTTRPPATRRPRPGNYWWYASYGGDANNNAATSTCGAAMSETVVAPGLPDADGQRPGDRHRRHGHPAANISSVLAALLGLERHRHHHLQGLRPRPPPRPPAPPGARRSARPRSRQRHLQPDGRLHADDRRQPTGGTRPTAATPTTTRRPRPVARAMSETVVGQAVADGDGERPGDRHRWDRHHGGQHQLDPRRAPRAPTPPAPSPSRSSPRPPPRPPAPPGAPRWARHGQQRQRHLHPVGRLHADGRRQLLVVRVLQRRHQQQRGDLDLWCDDVRRDGRGPGVTRR